MSRRESRPGIVERLLQLAVVLGAVLRRQPAPGVPRGVDADDLAAGYEHADMNPVVVGTAAVGLLIVLGLVLIGVTLLEQAVIGIPFTIGRPEDLVNGLGGSQAPSPPAPALEAEAGQTLNSYRAIEQRKLETYGWVDRSSGVIRMPIDRAIELTADRGLPSRAAPAATARDNGATSPSVASSGRVEQAYP